MPETKFTAVMKYGVGPLVAALAVQLIVKSWQEKKAEGQLKAQLARDGMQFVKDALDPSFTAADRRRIYDYLTNAFDQNSPMHSWAETGRRQAADDDAKFYAYVSTIEECVYRPS